MSIGCENKKMKRKNRRRKYLIFITNILVCRLVLKGKITNKLRFLCALVLLSGEEFLPHSQNEFFALKGKKLT